MGKTNMNEANPPDQIRHLLGRHKAAEQVESDTASSAEI